jgi:hypothetical protein
MPQQSFLTDSKEFLNKAIRNIESKKTMKQSNRYAAKIIAQP